MGLGLSHEQIDENIINENNLNATSDYARVGYEMVQPVSPFVSGYVPLDINESLFVNDLLQFFTQKKCSCSVSNILAICVTAGRRTRVQVSQPNTMRPIPYWENIMG